MRSLRLIFLALALVCAAAFTVLSTESASAYSAYSAYTQPSSLQSEGVVYAATNTSPTRQSTPKQSTPKPTATKIVSFAPKKVSVYQANPDRSEQTGTCKTPVIAYCPPMVALTPRGTTALLFRGQETRSYLLYRSRSNPNIYLAGRQRNGARDGWIQLTLQFTSETTWQVKQTIQYDNDPKCSQITYFTGTFLR
jgi:hypothetical protein